MCNSFHYNVVTNISKLNGAKQSKASKKQRHTGQRLIGKYWKIFGCLQHKINQETTAIHHHQCHKYMHIFNFTSPSIGM